jgi:hypothetical protein
VLAILACSSEDPEDLAATESNARAVIMALEQCYEDSGGYPASLSELVPTCLDELPEAVTTRGMGWLYTAADDEYTLGYWYGATKYAVYVCLRGSAERTWDCHGCLLPPEPGCWGPFTPVPTPTITPAPESSACFSSMARSPASS